MSSRGCGRLFGPCYLTHLVTTFDGDAWCARVADNLSQGRLRLIFVADEISREARDELRRRISDALPRPAQQTPTGDSELNPLGMAGEYITYSGGAPS